MTAKKREEPGFVERAIDGLEDHFERGEQGEETGFERPDVEQEREEKDPKPNAEQFQHLTERAEQQKVEKREEQRDALSEERKKRVQDMSEQHVSDEQWSELIGRAREAAKAGNSEFQLMRFPSQLCTDGGRAINVSEEGWQETLRGEPQELYQRWKTKLKPQEFGLSAKILDFPDGFPGDAGLFLTWNK